jgi:hypothetical protein
VHRDELLQLLPQLNPSMTIQHFNQLMDQMFAGFKAGGDMGIMTSSQVQSAWCTRSLSDAHAKQCLQAVRAIHINPRPHLSWNQVQVRISCIVENNALNSIQAFIKLQSELKREGMFVEMGSEDPDGKNR